MRRRSHWGGRRGSPRWFAVRAWLKAARRGWRRRAGGLAFGICLIALGGCSDAGPITVASVTVSPDVLSLHPMESRQLTATPLDARGNVLTGRTVTWAASVATVATVSRDGLVTAVAPGTVTITASCEGRSGTATVTVALAPVATVEVVPGSGTLDIGQTLQLTAIPRDSAGGAAAGWPVTWTSSDSATARVSAAGLVTAVAAGTASISAAAGGRTGSAVVVVQALSGDIAIVAAQFTQGVQDPDGTIPLILGGNGAVVNVLLSATRPIAAPMQVALRLSDTTGVTVWSDTAIVSAVPGPAPGIQAPSAQIFVPASVLRAGLRWQVLRDPNGRLPDDSLGNDRFPRTGPVNLATVGVPTLRIRFVPIVLAAHGGVTGQVSTASLSAYLQTLRSALPVGALDVSIGEPLTTQASFGSPPTGGAAAFWQQVLSEVDLARLADPSNSDAHWIGVVAPPPGFTYTAYGGFGYIPSSYLSTGANTRTSVLVNVGWFNRPTQTRDLVAHELGHNFGRRHAPCGGAGSPLDDAFPFAGGTIGYYGHDVYSLVAGLAATAATIDAAVGDVMGYCFPVWSSGYTYGGILTFRGSAGPSASAGQPPGRVLVVRGSIEDGTVTLQPAIALTAVASLPRGPGRYSLDGIADDGSSIFSYAFEPATLDHSPARPFTIAIPITERIHRSLRTIRVRGPAGQRTLTRPVPGAREPARAAAAVRQASGSVRLACADADARAIAVQEAESGALLGTGEGAALNVTTRSGTPLVLSCSDGIRTRSTTMVAP